MLKKQNVYYKSEKNSKKELHRIRSYFQNIYMISSNGHYSFFVTVTQEKKAYIHIFSFFTFKEIDTIEFYHNDFYWMIVYFMEYEGNRFIIFQENLNQEDEVGHTHIYSL